MAGVPQEQVQGRDRNSLPAVSQRTDDYAIAGEIAALEERIAALEARLQQTQLYGNVSAHKDTHVAGGADAFVATDVVEARARFGVGFQGGTINYNPSLRFTLEGNVAATDGTVGFYIYDTLGFTQIFARVQHGTLLPVHFAGSATAGQFYGASGWATVPQVCVVALNAMNIGGSNETERGRTRVPLDLFDKVYLTATADVTRPGNPCVLTAQWYNEATVSWETLGASISIESSVADVTNNISTIANIPADAIAQGDCWVRAELTNDNAFDDFFSVHLVFSKGVY